MTAGEKDRLAEIVAAAFAEHRFVKKYGPWDKFKINHPDIAEIYRDNAFVALDALLKAGIYLGRVA